MTTFQQGDVLAGKYRLDRAMARGGMGSVWVADHLQLSVTVAVKFMAPELAASADARSRFEREARAAAMLKSPNVVQVHDYGVEAGIPYIVMELLDGEDLEARLRREGRLTPVAMAKILIPACKALRRAHDSGLVHRDLKPANIFLARHDEDEIVKILDFGIVKDTASVISAQQTVGQLRVGTPHYMSPEQLMTDTPIDARSDLWSLGVIVYRCLTGSFPFPSFDINEVLAAICTAPIPAPSQIAPDLGPAVDTFFERALARDPDQRFPTAPAFAEAFVGLDWRSGGGRRVIPSDFPLPDMRTPNDALLPGAGGPSPEAPGDSPAHSGTLSLAEAQAGPGGTMILPDVGVRRAVGPKGTVRMVLDPVAMADVDEARPASGGEEGGGALPRKSTPVDLPRHSRQMRMGIAVGVVTTAAVFLGVAALWPRSRSEAPVTVRPSFSTPPSQEAAASPQQSSTASGESSAPAMALAVAPSELSAVAAPSVTAALSSPRPPDSDEAAAPASRASSRPKVSAPAVTSKKPRFTAPVVRDVQF